MAKTNEATQVLEVLKTFVGTIEATGGVIKDRHGNYSPVGDPEWLDLGDCYVEACGVLGREPKVEKKEED